MLKPADHKYLRAIYQISLTEKKAGPVLSDLAYYLDLRPPTVLERLRHLQKQKLLTYQRSAGIQLTRAGVREAMTVIRKHRIWETFLHKVCKFGWGEVHELAEQLQHVDSDKLIDRIYQLSGEPRFDPHGDPIPDKAGVLPAVKRRPLVKSVEGCRCVVLGVDEDSTEFLAYLTDLRIGLNDKLSVEKIFVFDGSVKVRHHNSEVAILSAQVAEKIQVTCVKPGCGCKAGKA
jgi:DtxR family transcriptional regulator, Mn-dependent transcriptional regulator